MYVLGADAVEERLTLRRRSWYQAAMIHVERSRDPAIETDRRIAAARAQGIKKGYKAKGVRVYERALHELFHSKCAYCETPIDAHGVIEHLKPKNLYPALETIWENLYLVCVVCNAHKGAIDPVDRLSGRVWMLDPCTDDPQKFLYFQEDGFVTSKPNLGAEDEQRATRTISALGLNREHLVAQRRQQIALLAEVAQECMNEQPERWMETESIQELVAAEAPFSAAARDALDRLSTKRPTDSPRITIAERIIFTEGTNPPKHPTKHTLSFVALDMIGPFEHLELDIAPGWNLLLGDNGSGKSTLLRAIALALAGADTKAAIAASRLLRTDAETGTILLQTDHHAYESSLVRVRGDVVTTPRAETLVADAKWLALGFPAVRGHSTRDIAGPTITSSRLAGVHDLLPILDGIVDSRLDDTQQWIVNTALRADGNESEEIRMRHARLIDWWFDVVRDLLPGPDFDFARLDRETWKVLVRTNDGVIPIEQLSLGMVSTICWIGTLLRRLAEAYPESETPELEPALVLIDELDAHLHPSWQQRLVPLVRQRFPNVQVIAASHSALIANNLGPNEIVVLSRDEYGRVKPIRLNEPLHGLRADQVYTSPAFGLSATRGEAAETLINKYKKALAAADGSVDSKAELADLEARVRREISSPPETAEERQQLAEQLRATEETIRSGLRDASLDDLREMQALLLGQASKHEES